ncbi:MAG TPA: bifunctional methylenetetrahydrofolate dehydrogenase/methenyltetrahydrofolate cyclohydrolase FolD [Micropepsaceae bacterium]|nr:bifunctional methylenetetrahydrofolate dehydrogenase/methenyltetrahydrofolate cyclohydrolase FolD [Micropepsaceae bacterium]
MIIDGKAAGAQLRHRVATEAAKLKAAHAIVPCLAMVLVGDDPASAIYVGSKNNAAREVGFMVRDIRQPASIPEQLLLDIVSELNGDPSVHGILVQMPLPEPILTTSIIWAIDPLKDVDGLTPINLGRLMIGETTLGHGLAACTPSGAMILVKQATSTLAGKHALVIGRSNQVGRPMAHLLLQENCTVTIAHSRTEGLSSLCRNADIVVAAAGRAEMVRGDWIKPGAIVIDVGINRMVLGSGKTRLAGDVAFAEAVEIAAAITPVPGGVGPMTIACLMRNMLIAACLQAGLPQPCI